ncbi:chorismate mutase [Fusobacterium sp. PH5-44]|uniref:chorismate mutase n=1 Tax=unclassified Fusobacterium TaxID=2648384 RepID=UPI003D2022A7
MTLDEIRIKIDQIDNEIKELFIKRMECAKEVANTKNITGGDVFVPERENIIIEKRSEGINDEIKNGYIAFLKHLMSVSRQYQYGILKNMQNDVVGNLKKNLKNIDSHRKISITFNCQQNNTNLNLYINMIVLNSIRISEINIKDEKGTLKCNVTLEGALEDENMKILLCQLGKEAPNFSIVEVL